MYMAASDQSSSTGEAAAAAAAKNDLVRYLRVPPVGESIRM